MSTFTQLSDETITSARIEIGAGLVDIQPATGEETVVSVDLQRGDEHELRVEVVDGELIVEGPRNSRRGTDVQVRIATPRILPVRAKTGSADITIETTAGSCRLNTGSGDILLSRVEGDLSFTTGSGDVRADVVTGVVRGLTGSGDVEIATVDAAAALTTGSGDVRIGTVAGRASIKVGSGDITIERIQDHSVATSGSGDVVVEVADGPSVQAETARGDVQIGVPAGVPTFLDLRTVTGDIHCDLEPGERPAEGEHSLLLKARTVSGDIRVNRV